MKVPRLDEVTKAKLLAALPREGIVIKPMFANFGVFANGNMFAGVFGDRILIRLPEARRATAEREGAVQFEMMPGRPMKDYVEVPGSWMDDAAKLREWLKVGFDHANSLPTKKKKRAGAAKPSAKTSTRVKKA